MCVVHGGTYNLPLVERQLGYVNVWFRAVYWRCVMATLALGSRIKIELQSVSLALLNDLGIADLPVRLLERPLSEREPTLAPSLERAAASQDAAVARVPVVQDHRDHQAAAPKALLRTLLFGDAGFLRACAGMSQWGGAFGSTRYSTS